MSNFMAEVTVLGGIYNIALSSNKPDPRRVVVPIVRMEHEAKQDIKKLQNT
jgi:hypothetical protein